MGLKLTNEQYNSLVKEQTELLPNGDVKIINGEYLCVNVPAICSHMNLSIIGVRHHFEKQKWVYYMSQGHLMFFRKKKQIFSSVLHFFTRKNRQKGKNDIL